MGKISDYLNSKIDNNDATDIVSFCENPSLLNTRLIPNQRMWLKLFCREPLDDTKCDIEVKDKFCKNVIGTFTERGYFDFMYSRGHISMSYDRIYNDSRPILEIFMNCGRRSTKTTLIDLLTAYGLYQTLLIECPQDYYNILESDVIMIPICSKDSGNARDLAEKLIQLLQKSPFFSRYIASANSESITLYTKRDLQKKEKGLKVIPSIVVEAKSKSGPRGQNSYKVILDEYAFFNESERVVLTDDGPKKDDIKAYNALMPSLSTLKNRETGNPVGTLYAISTPNGTNNHFYERVSQAFKAQDDSMVLAISAPTNYMNPTVTSEFLENAFHESPSTFSQEFGAEFSFAGASWLTNTLRLYGSFDKRLIPDNWKFDLKKQYFIGLDIGGFNDNTAIAVCHYERDYPDHTPETVSDSFRLYYGDNPYNFDEINDKSSRFKKTPGCYVIDHFWVRSPKNKVPVPFDEICEYLQHLFMMGPQMLYCIHDQYASVLFDQLIEQYGLTPKVETFNVTAATHSFFDKTFQSMMYANQLRLPENEFLMNEISSLRLTRNVDNLIKAEVPAPGHDDLYSAITMSLILCKAFTEGTFSIAGRQIIGLERVMQGLGRTAMPSSMDARFRVQSRLSAQRHGFVHPLKKSGGGYK